jgi:hypothetical protein
MPDSADYPYVQPTERFQEFLEEIQKIGIPDAATNQWLEENGYTSSYDRKFKNVLKFLDFAQDDGTPRDRWRQYRAKPEQVMAKAVSESYSELFRSYPEACEREAGELEPFFAARTDSGEQVIQKQARLFKILCEFSDFDALNNGSTGVASTDNGDVNSDADGVKSSSDRDRRSSQLSGPDIHIDIQVHVSPEMSSEQIDQVFESMAEHLNQFYEN